MQLFVFKVWVQESLYSKVLLEIKQMELRFNFVIIPIWAPRTNKQIQLADEGSKFFSSTDEWVFDDYSYANICSFFGKVPTIDAFATSTNARCFKFFSKIPQVGSLGVNFFCSKSLFIGSLLLLSAAKVNHTYYKIFVTNQQYSGNSCFPLLEIC